MLFLSAPLAWAAEAPRLPCGSAPNPDYAPIGAPAHTALWTQAMLGRAWVPPACTGWAAADFSRLVAVAGREREAGGSDAVLARLGAVSTLAGMRYWSTTEHRWEPLGQRAAALAARHGERRRDFSVAELRPGADVYYTQADNRTGEDIVYRLHIAAATPDHLVFDIVNVTGAKWHFLPALGPGDLQTVFFIDRSGDGWAAYSLMRVGPPRNPMQSLVPDQSYINRAVAMYRHVLGIPTDREPPAAP